MSAAVVERFYPQCSTCGEDVIGEGDRTIHWKCETRDTGALSLMANQELADALKTLKRINFLGTRGSKLANESRALAKQIDKYLKRWRDGRR